MWDPHQVLAWNLRIFSLRDPGDCVEAHQVLALFLGLFSGAFAHLHACIRVFRCTNY